MEDPTTPEPEAPEPEAEPPEPIEAGVHRNLPEAAYHADRASLSSSGARRLLTETPAHFNYYQNHAEPPKRAYDFGTVAHELVLGKGAGIEVIQADSWRTKKAKEAAEEARAEGKTPILSAVFNRAEEMAEAVHRHPVASKLFMAGEAETSIFWPDPEFPDVMRRARLDWWTQNAGYEVIVDYKSTADASDRALQKSIVNYGYHQQDRFYIDAVESLGHEQVVFLFVFQEKTPPYEVRVIQLPSTACHIGDARNRRAIELYKQCRDSGQWPGYSEAIDQIGLPRWAERDQA